MPSDGSAAEIDAHMRGRRPFDDIDDLALEAVACADFHGWLLRFDTEIKGVSTPVKRRRATAVARRLSIRPHRLVRPRRRTPRDLPLRRAAASRSTRNDCRCC